jgi:hypothetical protein
MIGYRLVYRNLLDRFPNRQEDIQEEYMLHRFQNLQKKTLTPILTADLSMPQSPDQGEDISFQALSVFYIKLCSTNSYSDDQLEGREKG